MISAREYKKNSLLLSAILLQRELEGSTMSSDNLSLSRELSLEVSDLLRAYEANYATYIRN